MSSANAVDIVTFMTWSIAKFFKAEISIETTVYNGRDIALLFFSNTGCAHLSSDLLVWNDSCSCEEILHMFHAELNMHVGVSCQVPGLLFSLFNHSSEYGMRQTGSCIGFLINKTWGTLNQIKGVLISSSGPLCFLWLKERTKLTPISSWEVWMRRRWWWRVCSGWRTAEQSREKTFHVRAACQISATAPAQIGRWGELEKRLLQAPRSFLFICIIKDTPSLMP